MRPIPCGRVGLDKISFEILYRAPVAQRIEHYTPNVEIEVQFLSGAQGGSSFKSILFVDKVIRYKTQQEGGEKGEKWSKKQ